MDWDESKEGGQTGASGKGSCHESGDKRAGAARSQERGAQRETLMATPWEGGRSHGRVQERVARCPLAKEQSLSFLLREAWPVTILYPTVPGGP